MDYVVGSVAALISGNVTPNRPKLIRRALTPTKHQASPNVTPKSEFVEDRSIFLSPTLQKKKAIVKKSPKRIFQNPDLDLTENFDGNSTSSPKADKVKKHLKDELDTEVMAKMKSFSPNLSNDLNKSTKEMSPKKKSKIVENADNAPNTPNKKKKKRNSESNIESDTNKIVTNIEEDTTYIKSPSKKAMKRRKSVADDIQDVQIDNQTESPKKAKTDILEPQTSNKNKKKNKKKNKNKSNVIEPPQDDSETNKENKTNKKKKNKSKDTIKPDKIENNDEENLSESDDEEQKSKNIANPNAITEKDTDSEHESDNEIDSENDDDNETDSENEKDSENDNEKDSENEDDKVLNKDQEQSSDEEEESTKKQTVKQKDQNPEVMSEEEVKRTLFVGNVPFSAKCKKEIKKIFNQYGQIETIRIRTIPVKDARVTPKLAVIKNELHPERSTVNVYIKYADQHSVTQALSANNTVLNNHHLRVSLSNTTGAEHDPRLAVFVGNLPFAIEDETLRAKFESCGEIESVRVVRDKKTNAGKGFGYVNFATKDGVELALALTEDDLTIKNRILRVNRCTQSGSKGAKKQGGNQGGKWGRNQDRLNQGRFQGKPQNRGYQVARNQDRGNQNPRNQDRGNQNPRNQDRGNQNHRNQDRGNQNPRNQGRSQDRGNQGRSQGQAQRWNQDRGKFKGNPRQDGKWGQKEETGAARRLMFKRKPQDGGEGPPNKKQNINKEKKPKKEFLGLTAEKKKKQKFNKDAKKKKAISEILTKKM